MPMIAVGFRLGRAVTGRQVTVLLTESGVLHRSHGLYGQPSKLDLPKLPLRHLHPDLSWRKGEHILTGPISSLRDHHVTATERGYTEVLIAPACVRLDVEEQPLPLKENPRAARRHPELTDAFIGTAPHTEQSLDAAVDDFRTALGLPVRPRNVTWRPRRSPVPPRIEAMLRTLAHGTAITSPERLAVGWSVTPRAVTLRVGRTAEALDRPAVLELQAALTAWLRLTQPPTS
ncbi:hypothetical protein [Streptomyces sp. NBC_01264]|uniref:hypothetical protein n=1 Tax=Streptomyces sp. NBC_01264 TaxID=2903804 RepID=UPI002258F906|nr:hypothetical protein [Streptomyces sp. NBC_01264]MCX4775578.1 hypothetical protein [Streptomyces sp. NBC_01264]